MKTENNTNQVTINVVTGNKAVKLTPNEDGFARIDSLVGNMSKRHITVEIIPNAVCVWNFVNKTVFGACIKEGIKSLNYDEKIIISNDYKIYKTDEDALEKGIEMTQEELFVRALTEKEVSSNRYEYNGHIYKIVAEDDTPDGDDTVTDAENYAGHSDSDIETEITNLTMEEINSRIENGTNIDKLIAPTITFKQLQQKIQNKLNRGIDIKELTGIEQLIIKIKSVEKLEDGLKIKLNNGRAIKLFYDGKTQRFDRRGISCGKPEYKLDNDRLRIAIEVKKEKASNTSILVEKIMLLAWSAYIDKIPANATSLTANVMDLSGSRYTAKKLGISMNFHPSNLEWCIGDDNSAHGATVRKLLECTGHVYRVSALDTVMKQLTRDRDTNIELINYYIEKTGIEKVR